ncbi:UvrD-helicase domain-containing protein [Pseudomonas sp. NPDC090755]|uniref:UvrD-helicase domain-containing protein n=1 Tax=Pseudomonas sp. NPDC090755 TaxID=3364481 RepID=UPI00383B995C
MTLIDLVEHGLNKSQILAINTPGSVFLSACPGSGKTRTLAFKIAVALTNLETSKKYIVAITYTHRAADEILERIEALGLDTSRLWIGTIHSFCLEWILRPYAIYEPRLESGFTIINQPDTERILEEICSTVSDQRISTYDCNYHFMDGKVALLCNDLSKHANIRKVLRTYFSILKENRQIDFELILYFAEKILTSHPVIPRTLSEVFELIALDEYQDTKFIQYSILFSIYKSGNGKTKAFVVGDPNQAIFESLGGHAIAYAEFKKRSQLDVTELSLNQNYRTSQNLVDYYSNFQVVKAATIAEGENKNHKSLIVWDKDLPSSQLEERVCNLIDFCLKDLKCTEEEICIVGPQWPSLAALTRRLMAKRPEYRFNGPGMIPFGRELDNFWYKLSRICLSEPAPDMYIRRMRWATEILSSLSDAGCDCPLSNKELLRELNQVTSNESDGLRYLEHYFASFLEIVDIIDITSYPDLDQHYQSFFESSRKKITKAKKDGLDLIEGIEFFKRAFKPRAGITISTIHGIKGAEFENVISFSLLEGLVPHWAAKRSTDSANKLLYVVCSRAKKNLFLISEAKTHKSPTKVLSGVKFLYDTGV